MLGGFFLHVRLHFVGMEEQGLLAVSLTDVVLGGAWFEAEEFIVVGLVVLLVSAAHCCWCSRSKKRIRGSLGWPFSKALG